MIIKSWRQNFDTWSYVHWIGAAYLTATEGWQYAAFWIVLWEGLDVAWRYVSRKIANKYVLCPVPLKTIQRAIFMLESGDRIFDSRGLSYGDLLMGWAGIMTFYAHVGVGWWAGLSCAACVFAVIEMSRE